MTKSLEKSITFRIDEHLDKTITLYAKEKGYKHKSDLIRDLLTMHFMNVLLGYLPDMKTYDDMQKEFMAKTKEIKKRIKKSSMHK
jgi:hypothetical protein